MTTNNYKPRVQFTEPTVMRLRRERLERMKERGASQLPPAKSKMRERLETAASILIIASLPFSLYLLYMFAWLMGE